MKFSWKSLNYFIDLSQITINELAELLTIRGFEIDNISKNKYFNDYILDIDITSNRTDSLSIIGLAQELAHILNTKFIKYNNICQYKTSQFTAFNISNLQDFSKIHINKIVYIRNKKSPKWLIDYLNIHEIDSCNLLHDIQEYIKLKWGHEIYFFNIPKTKNSNKDKQQNTINILNTKQHNDILNNITTLILSNTLYKNKLKYDEDAKSFFVVSCNYHKQKSHNSLCFSHAHSEALQLLATFSQGYISKSYIYYNSKNKNKNLLKINKNQIQDTLGPINIRKNKYLNVSLIYKLLKQLNFKPTYNYYTKNFHINIPAYRLNDLSRNIDIIEEIGRIYGYEHFIDKIPYINTKGKISNKYLLMKSIRKYFRNHGLHEVVNSSLYKNFHLKLDHTNNDSMISLYNPLLQEQSQLRSTLIDNLVQNKIYNYKQKNNHAEIFEIGKIFIHNNNYYDIQEEIHVAGILANQSFIKKSWKDEDSNLSWFHAKGILEEFIETLNIKIIWKKIDELKTNDLPSLSLNSFNLKQTVLIVNLNNDQVIGILGTINQQYYKELPKNEIIYTFILNLDKLQSTYVQPSHLSYTFSKYSLYPSVIRDISIKINKKSKIIDVQKKIHNTNIELIKKVEVFNEYENTKYPNHKFIGIRITYNSKTRTLNNNDLKRIDYEINHILNQYK
uniref:phenylalanine--tRNA ligase n=1 Tax=Centroceras clavulatum TaxID=159503 RepID=A0A4D6WMJ4_9FLOR|nr:Phenylalanine-tRNA ligase beta subunit [Centroceras clavulatum]